MADDAMNVSGPPPELLREIARQGEVRLAAILDVATAADVRATTLCGIYGASTVALTAAVLAYVASGHVYLPLLVAGAAASLLLFIAAGVAGKAGAPVDFHVAGGLPASLRNWSWTASGWRGIDEMLDATGQRYATMIQSDAEILAKGARRVNASLKIAGATPIIAVVIFFLVRWL